MTDVVKSPDTSNSAKIIKADPESVGIGAKGLRYNKL
jgi:hypothetical protein